MVLTERGGLLTIDGTHIVSGPLGFTPPYPYITPYSGIYVADPAAGAVFVFALTANGNVAPATTLTGGLTKPICLTVDPSGYIYVLDRQVQTQISIFYPGASGAASPFAILTGNFGNGTLLGVSLGPDNKLWVLSGGAGVDELWIDRFPLQTGGNISPLSEMTFTGIPFFAAFNNPAFIGISWDSTGAFYIPGYSASENWGFAAQTTGPLTAATNITSIPSEGGGITAGPVKTAVIGTKLFIANGDSLPGSIVVYPTSATGSGAPSTAIVGSGTGLGSPAGMSVDSSHNLWVANSYLQQSAPGAAAVLAFSASASGNVLPIVNIAGSATGLLTPTDVCWFAGVVAP